jgi:hypothetical protein
LIFQAARLLPEIPGDFDGDGVLTAADIDMLTSEVIMGNHPPGYDLNKDKLVDEGDHDSWVHELKNTWFGDADLNLEFNSSDMVQVFTAGKYETGEDAGWTEGDWNADLKFNSTDMVAAFVDGGYENGLRPAASAVPEPTSVLLLVTGVIAVAVYRRRPRR